MIDWLSNPMTLVWAAYFGALEILSWGTSKLPLCIVISKQHAADNQSGDIACATFSEGIMQFLWFAWDKASHDNVVAIATVFIALFTLTLWRSSRKLWLAGERQIELSRLALISSRRAWVTIEDVKLRHPASFTEDGIRFSVQATIKNIGRSPALSVWVEFESYFLTNNSENFLAAEKRILAKARAHPKELGRILFPDDILVQGEDWADAPDKFKNAIRSRPTGEKVIEVMIFIIVSYRIVGDDETHITYYLHDMMNVPMGFTLPNPGQTQELSRTAFMPGVAD